MCFEHPHHTIWQLLSLANADQASSSTYKSNIPSSRCEVAKTVLRYLKSSKNGKFSNLLMSIESLCNAYIKLAGVKTDRFNKANCSKHIPFKELYDRTQTPFHECLDGASRSLPIPTVLVPIRPDKSYDNLVWIHKFESTFSITESGISRPKIIECIGTDGIKYKQLLKSGDDTRQDAVMQQVFHFVNHILCKEERTRQRRLSIRTYKVVPMTPLIGLLEWVDNTTQFGAYLSESDTGAHSRYYPDDWSHVKCREYLSNASSDKPNDQLNRLQEIYDNFQPAFHHFFLEHYLSSTQWVSRRLAYVRSVAVTSIVGYILGIGDRHAYNILIDITTAEVVHIDFGIVFDQGKGLGTPETVPFRLTRDVIDGMGICKTEGTYRKSCEEVLKVLRENTLELLTILSVVIHDPLYKWSLSPNDVRNRQIGRNKSLINYTIKDDSKLDNLNDKGHFSRDAAERTLQKIKSKLLGYEDPTGEGLSVEGHVDYLINEAKGVENLCKIFPGWGPWL
jgi:ataxia telangiectasia mutated family protein